MKERLLLICTLFFLSGYAIAQNDIFNKDSVFTWGMNAYASGDIEGALQHFETYLENAKDSSTAQYATVLHKTANIATIYGDSQTALNFYKTALDIRTNLFGRKHPDCASLLINIGCVYQNIGRHTEALKYLEEGTEIDRKFWGEKSQYYGEDIHNIGNSYYGLRDYANAEKYYKKAAEIKKNAVGENDYDYAITISMLANLYSDMDDHETALKYYEKASNILKSTSDHQHDYANTLSSMGTLYSALGNYKKALELYNKAKTIFESQNMEDRPDFINILNNIASAHYFMGNYDKSLEMDKQIADIVKSTVGESTTLYATALNNIGTIYLQTRNYDKALEYLRESSKIRKELLGENNIEYAKSLTNIGNVLLKKGDTKNSLENYRKALDIIESVFGKGHNLSLDYLTNIANCHFIAKNYTEAQKYFSRTFDIGSKYLKKNFSYLSSHEREMYWNENNSTYNTIIGNALMIPNDASATKCAYNSELITKGLLLSSEIEFNKLISESKNKSLIAEFDEMRRLCLLLNNELDKPTEERIYNCDSLENEIQKKERYLVENCRQYGDFTKSIAIDWKNVRSALKSNNVAIEFTNYKYNEDSTVYAAILLTKNMDSPVIVRLFEQKEIGQLLRGIAPVKPETPSEEENRGATSISARRQGIYESSGLYNLVWKPLEKYFPENPRIYFAPSGMLHQIAVEYAPISHEQTISDKYEIYRVSSTRFLAMDYMPKPMKNSVLYGGIYYDSDTTTMKHESDRYSTRSTASYTSFANFNRNEDRGSLNYLPGTKTEVENIVGKMKKSRIKSKLYEGSQANEESFKALSGKEISTLHIATHGFFLSTDENMSGDQSLVQSGLLLSGANYAWQNKPIPEGIEDGILTAKEISFMDLRKTDLVVLSACQTALGEITGEGVFGLQRGFKKAGARTIIMSLWPVDDNATLLMMTEFYTNLTKGMTKREAFLAAQNKVKTTEGFGNPRYWAAFIMLDGDN